MRKLLERNIDTIIIRLPNFTAGLFFKSKLLETFFKISPVIDKNNYKIYKS